MTEHTEKYYELQPKYPKFITKTTLRKWVLVYEKSRGTKGITADEFEDITGEEY